MKVKYPRTPHFAWSEGNTSDDKVMNDLSNFIGKEVIITEKMDGENTTLMHDSIYTGSLDSSDHPSRHTVKGMWETLKNDIPEEWRVCGENLFAQHALFYPELPDYFMVFSVWDDRNVCLSVAETQEWCSLLGLRYVPVLWRGMFDENLIKDFKIDTETQEGYVVRLCNEFPFEKYNVSVAKYVRKGHVSDDDIHWMQKKIIKNELR